MSLSTLKTTALWFAILIITLFKRHRLTGVLSLLLVVSVSVQTLMKHARLSTAQVRGVVAVHLNTLSLSLSLLQVLDISLIVRLTHILWRLNSLGWIQLYLTPTVLSLLLLILESSQLLVRRRRQRSLRKREQHLW